MTNSRRSTGWCNANMIRLGLLLGWRTTDNDRLLLLALLRLLHDWRRLLYQVWRLGGQLSWHYHHTRRRLRGLILLLAHWRCLRWWLTVRCHHFALLLLIVDQRWRTVQRGWCCMVRLGRWLLLLLLLDDNTV